ncbi:MAG: hypothetical protein AAFY84_06065 [Pseudomonadota bacterium]
MTSGRDALHRIDAAIADARQGLKSASSSAATDARSLADFDRQELEIFNGIAKVRLAHLKDEDTFGGSLGLADHRAEDLMKKHDAHIEEIGQQRDKARQEIEALEAKRRDTEGAHETALTEHDEAVTATRQKLELDPDYIARAQAVEVANSTAARADQKLQIALTDRTEKGAPYEADPLFAYLRERHYATAQYKAFPLYAMLDDWVARLIKYRDHKLNYDRLLEIPDRLQEHVDRLEEAANAAETSLEAFERKAMEQDGIGALREKVGELATKLQGIDGQIKAAEEWHEGLIEQFSKAVAGEAGPLSEARSLLTDVLKERSVPDLKVLAAETETLEDDRLVEALIQVKMERFELEEARKTAARSLKRQARSLSELEDVRRKFKTRRFDSPYSEFSGRDLVGALVSEFIRGRLSRDELWRKIERSHRTRRREWDNDMGGDEWRDIFGLPDNWGGTSEGSWGGGNWGGGPRPPRLPRAPRRTRTRRVRRAPRVRFPSGGGGRRGGGGFKTGGGF